LGTFAIKDLNLTHVSQRGSLDPWEKVAMVDIALMNLDGGNTLVINFCFTFSQVLRLLFGCDWSQVFALPTKENGKALS